MRQRRCEIEVDKEMAGSLWSKKLRAEGVESMLHVAEDDLEESITTDME